MVDWIFKHQYSCAHDAMLTWNIDWQEKRIVICAKKGDGNEFIPAETLKWLVTEHFPEDGIEAWDDDNAGWVALRTDWSLYLSFAGMQLPIQVIKQRVLDGDGTRFVLEIGLPREAPLEKRDE